MSRKIWSGIIILVLLSGLSTTAIATYPEGALAALNDPLDAINQLFARIAELERRIGVIERLLGIGGNKTTERMEYPYTAVLTTELEGKIEAKYNWHKVYSREWNETKEEYGPKILTDIEWNIFLRNLSNQTIRKIYYDIIVKDETGNVILNGSDIIVVSEIGTTPEGESYIKEYTLRETPIYAEVPPGGTTYFRGSAWIKQALEKAGIDPISDPKLTVEIVIVAIKFS